MRRLDRPTKDEATEIASREGCRRFSDRGASGRGFGSSCSKCRCRSALTFAACPGRKGAAGGSCSHERSTCRLRSVHWSSGLSVVEHMEDGRLERIVLTDRTSTYGDGARVGGRRSRTAAGTSAKRGGATAASTNEAPRGVRSSGRSLGFGVPGWRRISRMAGRLSS